MEPLVPLEIGGEQYFIRYPGLAQIIIQKSAGEFLGLPNKRISVTDLMGVAASGDVEAQAYLLWQGIIGGMPEKRKMKFEEAVELRDQYLLQDDLDDGSRYMKFLEAIGTAIDAAFGADRKKAQTKQTEERKAARLEELKTIYLAKMKAEEEAGTGQKPTESA